MLFYLCAVQASDLFLNVTSVLPITLSQLPTPINLLSIHEHVPSPYREVVSSHVVSHYSDIYLNVLEDEAGVSMEVLKCAWLVVIVAIMFIV